MDVPDAHPPAVERDGLLLNPGDVPLIFGDNFRLELAVPIPGDIDLELPNWLLSFLREWPLRLSALSMSPFCFFS